MLQSSNLKNPGRNFSVNNLMKAAYCLIYSIADNSENIHSLIGFGQPSINLIDALKCSVRRYCIDATAHLTCYLMPYRNVL